MSNIKTIAVRFNLDKEADKKFYESLADCENGVYSTPTQYAKVIICRYLSNIKNTGYEYEEDEYIGSDVVDKMIE